MADLNRLVQAAKSLLALIEAGTHRSYGQDGKTGDPAWLHAVVELRSATLTIPIASGVAVHAVRLSEKDVATLCCRHLIGPNTKTSSTYERVTCADR